jgi:hypothetical protein
MKRKYIKMLIALIFLTVFLLLLAVVLRTANNRMALKSGSDLPEFSFMTLSDTLFKSSELQSGPLLIVNFHPECEHCQFEISEIFSQAKESDNFTTLLISASGKKATDSLLCKYDWGILNFKVLIDSINDFSLIFHSKSFPTNIIYDKRLKLVKLFSGECKYETLLKYISANE